MLTDNCGIEVINIAAGTQSGDVFPTGTTTVTVEALDTSGNSALCTFEVLVESILLVSATGTDVSCNGGNDGDIVIIGNGGLPPYTFTIENGAPGQLSAGIYTVMVTDADNCTASTEVEVLEPTAIEIEISQVVNEENTTGNGAIVINVSGGVEGYTFSWTGSNNFTSTEEDLLNLSAGDYALVVTDANGCEMSSEVVTIDNLTSVEEPIWAKNLRLFPNPATDILTLELPAFTASDLIVELLNVTGQTMQVIDKERNSNVLRMNVSTLPSGLYWLKMQMEGELVVRKVVVE